MVVGEDEGPGKRRRKFATCWKISRVYVVYIQTQPPPPKFPAFFEGRQWCNLRKLRKKNPRRKTPLATVRSVRSSAACGRRFFGTESGIRVTFIRNNPHTVAAATVLLFFGPYARDKPQNRIFRFTYVIAYWWGLEIRRRGSLIRECRRNFVSGCWGGGEGRGELGSYLLPNCENRDGKTWMLRREETNEMSKSRSCHCSLQSNTKREINRSIK